jgi:hypothetical protein
MFKALEVVNWLHGPYEVKLTLMKRDVRGGFDLGGMKERAVVIIKNINFYIKEKEYWKEIFNTIVNAGNEWGVKIPHKRAQHIIQVIRNHRYQYRRPKFQTWADRYGKKVADWAMNIIEDGIEDPCKSHFRLARKGDKKALGHYENLKLRGCCGEFDVIRRCPFDYFKEYHIGCNYGH